MYESSKFFPFIFGYPFRTSIFTFSGAAGTGKIQTVWFPVKVLSELIERRRFSIPSS
jgi:hypothetical protein